MLKSWQKVSFADVECQINGLIDGLTDDLVGGLVGGLIDDLIDDLIDGLIGGLIGGLIEADSAVCKVLVKAGFCRCNLSVDSESPESSGFY